MEMVRVMARSCCWWAVSASSASVASVSDPVEVTVLVVWSS